MCCVMEEFGFAFSSCSSSLFEGVAKWLLKDATEEPANWRSLAKQSAFLL